MPWVIVVALFVPQKEMVTMYDVIIIGAGVVGCAAAHSLSRYNLKVAVLEKGADVATGTSRANSGIVHAGYDPRPGTLMAELNVQGNAMYPDLCRKLDIPFRQLGSLVVATAGKEEQLKKLLARGRANGVTGLSIIGRDAVLDCEPKINTQVEAALYAPSAGIVSPWELTLALAETAAVNGVEFRFNTKVTGILTHEDSVQGVETQHGKLWTRVVINAAGVYADILTQLAGAERYDILPRKGEYLLLDKDLDGYVQHVVFPVPTALGKGTLVLPTVEGNILAGPTAVDVEEREDVATTEAGLAQVKEGAARLFPDLPWNKVITSFAGLRAVPADGDFVLRSSARVRGWIDAGGIQSPGLTAAPAIGEKLTQLVAGQLDMPPKAHLLPRPEVLRIREMSLADREKWIAENPSYGQIVCRCEGVSQGEIVDAIQRPIPATTLDGIKQRTRAGGGRCQGGFCQPRMLTIMARELGISPMEITKFGPGSELVTDYLSKGGGR